MAGEEVRVHRGHEGVVVVGGDGGVAAEPFASEEGEDSAGVYGGHEAALVVEPCGVAFGGDAVADEGEAGGAEGDELVGVNGDVVGGFRAAEGEEVPGHPVVLAAGEAFDGFAEVTAEGSRAAFAGGADEGHGEALVEGHGDEGGFAVAGDAFDADVFGVYRGGDGGVGCEEVEGLAGAPGPGAEGSPV
jgi:hypothetical protein